MTRPGEAAEIEPRLLPRRQAAAYCSLTESGFSEWVREKRLPGPLPGTKRWDRRALDACLDKLSGIKHAPDDSAEGERALDEWLGRRKQ